ncbi:hypothetical protein SAMN00768000_1364 [Sulfobacillus thermosulfidooxidans DSM 9293]|uniref:Uncharacterized protein n=1 Tax=Sulfobacillus thermosulfidooxidans (strain DSM 9293 / VKM B-1269 / AT-1) TaxID=929705 RepID=A0A1W1WDY2_SULTA|nr:hypothetical protein [Sulfobacillus thermosulfidooxidans]SMC03933.1 hypothetical protein SAMN00768000_1364 [Sulfobacillus thermosulfidooxidans DSM 9293]
MWKQMGHWGLPVILSSGLLALPSLGTINLNISPVATQNVTAKVYQSVPRYPHSVAVIAPPISSPFAAPLVLGAENHLSKLWQLPTSYDHAENWYMHEMEKEGYHLISQAMSSLAHSESLTYGLLFAQGPQETTQVAINFLPLNAHTTNMQYIVAELPVPSRPQSSRMAPVSAVREITVHYRAWRYGSPLQSFTLNNPKTIAPVVDLLNHLPVLPPELFHCAADFGQGATLIVHFRNGKQWVIRDNAACDSVQIPHAPALQDVHSSLYHLLGQDAKKFTTKGTF